MTYEYDFSERMDTGRQTAMDARNRGRPVGKPAAGWNKRKRAPEDTPENRLYAELAALRAKLRDAENTIDQYKLSHGQNDVADFGAEFDKLAGPRDWRPADPIIADSPGPRGHQGVHAMNTKQYLAALKKLELTPASKSTAATLGLSVRQCQRIAAGDSAVPEAVAKLLAMYLEYGAPAGDE